jgi:hypothetical protein
MTTTVQQVISFLFCPQVAIGFLKEVGMFLQEVSPQAKSLNGALRARIHFSSAS